MFEQTNETAALVKACRSNDVVQAERAIKNGAIVHSENFHGNTPLHYACMQEDNFSLVELLFQHEADADSPNTENETPLMAACRWDDCPVKTVKYIFEKTSPEVINARDKSGDSALNDVVCLREDVELAKWMLARGALLTSLNRHGIQKLGDTLLESELTNAEISLAIQILEHICCVEGNPELLKKIISIIDINYEKLSLEALNFLADYLRTIIKYQLEKDESVMKQFKDIQKKVILCMANKEDIDDERPRVESPTRK